MSWPIPTSPTELKSFLGLCSYYRRFIPHFSDIAHPLHQCATTVPFCWTTESENVFQRLKMSLTQAPILTYPDPSAMFILDTDASGTGIGAVLSQVSSPERGGILRLYPKSTWASLLRYPQGTFSSGEGYQTLSCLPLYVKTTIQTTIIQSRHSSYILVRHFRFQWPLLDKEMD